LPVHVAAAGATITGARQTTKMSTITGNNTFFILPTIFFSQKKKARTTTDANASPRDLAQWDPTTL